MIGDPETRYREDPVRMLRAVRFAAKLDFTIHADTAAPIPKLAWMLDGVPPARLFDEVNKMFLAGSAQRRVRAARTPAACSSTCFRIWRARSRMCRRTAAHVELLRLGLQGTDERVRAEKSVTPTFLFAILLWPAMQRAYRASSRTATTAIRSSCWQLAIHVTARQQARVAVPKRFTLPLREIVGLQPRFERREGRRALRLLNHPRFRAAYDFLVLRAAAGEADAELAQWWTDIQIGLGRRADRARGESRAGAATLRPMDRAVVAVAAAADRPPHRERSGVDAGVRRARQQSRRSAAPDRSRFRRGSRLLEGCRLVARSRLYRTAPLGPQDQPEFVNAAAGLLTLLAPRELLRALKSIEASSGARSPWCAGARGASISTCCCSTTCASRSRT